MNQKEFVAGWLDDTLTSRKCGRTHRLKYGDADFLLYSLAYDRRTSTPQIVAVRDKKSGAVIRDASRSSRYKAVPTQYVDTAWSADFDTFEVVSKRDITNWRSIDSKTIKTAMGEEITLVLIDIDGMRVITDILPGVMPTSVGDYLQFNDLRGMTSVLEEPKLEAGLYKVKGFPSTLEEARRSWLPENTSPETIIVNGLMAHPQFQMKDPEVSPELLKTARRRPYPMGYQIPESCTDYGEVRIRSNWRATEGNPEVLLGEARKKGFDDALIRSLEIYLKDTGEWKKAVEVVKGHIHTAEELSKLRIEAEESWRNGNDLYVKNPKRNGTKHLFDNAAFTEGVWYKIVRTSLTPLGKVEDEEC